MKLKKPKNLKAGIVKNNYQFGLALNLGDELTLVNSELQYGEYQGREYGYFEFDKGRVSLSKFGSTSQKVEWTEGSPDDAFVFPNTGEMDNFDALLEFINSNDGRIKVVAKGRGNFGDVYAFAQASSPFQHAFLLCV